MLLLLLLLLIANSFQHSVREVKRVGRNGNQHCGLHAVLSGITNVTYIIYEARKFQGFIVFVS